MDEERRMLNERLERLYMQYINVERCIKRLREIKDQYSYRSIPTKLKGKKRAFTVVDTDVKIENRFKDATKGCNKFVLEDPFWMEVSGTFNISRNECYNKWINEVEAFDIKVSKKELGKIVSMVDEKKDWLEISKELLCFPFRIFTEYVRAGLNSKPKMWTQEEDRLLEQGLAEYGASRWRFVSRIVGTKTGKECAMRFYFLNKNIKKGKWAIDEEARLVEALGIYSEGDWRSVSNHVMTRNPIQCRRKYFDELKSQKRAL